MHGPIVSNLSNTGLGEISGDLECSGSAEFQGQDHSVKQGHRTSSNRRNIEGDSDNRGGSSSLAANDPNVSGL